ncbi:NAD(P)/FAD-dependent oxidoreductase [Desulfopila sp. IMCC35008]|uniref:NAD(P)/FAD-dependent oxidoreductase n=1 Tax=Desulfopila sp. IMCC35008 TaxID=2653858 RepID=UPI0013D3466F|nr:NAD(P)/FAD-dependent oxidoreductase [Desulfopila sp. IMCC35008]
MKDESGQVIVIGGGAAGLMAAGTAAASGRKVLLLEKMETPARKIRITGKGRCNLSNSAELVEFMSHFGKSGKFLRQSFQQFFSGELVDFFQSRGLPVQHERGGRIFPAANDAPAVARVLIDWAKDCGVEFHTGERVSRLLIHDSEIRGVVAGGREYSARQVILATGGRSYPRTGSTGDGYRLAEQCGHTVIAPRPALVSLKTAKEQVRGLAKLNLRNISARLYINGSRKAQAFGELTFSGTGIGGPIILTLSTLAVDAIREKQRVAVHLDLKPALDDRKLDARLLRDLESRAKEPMESVLRGLLPQKMVPYCLREVEIAPEQIAGQLSAKLRKRLRTWLKDLRFDIIGHGSWEEAIVTAGGVKTSEVNPKTMESKRVKGLYIAGELLDIQADTGGYNLQAAFSTGWVAGQAAARVL